MKTFVRQLSQGLALQVSAIGLALLTILPLHSSSLPKELVDADAKWLFFSDFNRLRATQTGSFVEKQFLNEAYEEMSASLKFDVKALASKIQWVLAYGTEFKTGNEGGLPTGVMIIKADAETQKIVTGLVAAQLLSDTNSPVKQVQTEPYPLYTIRKDLSAAIQEDGLIVFSKSKEQLDRATEVRQQKRASLGKSSKFSDFPTAPDAFFLMGVAEGFAEGAPVPPQAKVLQMADGARIILDERDERLMLELALKGKTQDVVNQMQQVAQGMIALFSLGEPQDPDLQTLVRSAKVQTKAKVVSIGIEFPVGRALERFKDEPRGEQKKSQRKNKANKKNQSEPDSAEPKTPTPENEPKF